MGMWAQSSMLRSVCLASLVACGRLGFEAGAPSASDPIDAARAGDASAVLEPENDAALPGPLVWLLLDDSLADAQSEDSSGHGLHARCVQGAGCPDQTGGHADGGLGGFSPSKPGLEVADEPRLRLSSLTLTAWVRGDFPASTISSVFGKPLGTGTDNSYQLWINASQQLSCRLGRSGDPFDIKEAGGFIARAQTGAWVHTACSYDGRTGELRLYVDGQLVASALGIPPPEYDGSPVTIGADRGSGGSVSNLYTGTLDDLRIYDRVLSPDELAAIAGP